MLYLLAPKACRREARGRGALRRAGDLDPTARASWSAGILGAGTSYSGRRRCRPTVSLPAAAALVSRADATIALPADPGSPPCRAAGGGRAAGVGPWAPVHRGLVHLVAGPATACRSRPARRLVFASTMHLGTSSGHLSSLQCCRPTSFILRSSRRPCPASSPCRPSRAPCCDRSPCRLGAPHFFLQRTQRTPDPPRTLVSVC